MSERDAFRIVGDCWCPGTMTLDAVRLGGHTADCTAARKGWEANRRHLSELDRQKRADEAAGRQLREAALAVLDRSAGRLDQEAGR